MIEPFSVDDYRFRKRIAPPRKTIQTEGHKSNVNAIGSIRDVRQSLPESEILIRFIWPRKQENVLSLSLESEKVDKVIAGMEELAQTLRNARDVSGS